MSSWIPQLFNPFTDGDDNPNPPEHPPPQKSATAAARDDLSAVFRGVAAFLAPPPAAAASSSSEPASSSETIEGIKSDLAEIQGTFRSGLSLISSKISSNLLQLQNQLGDRDDGSDDAEEEEEDGLGISDEILDFVSKISRRRELWTDFPLSLPDDGETLRLNDKDLKLLSTPQASLRVAKARETLLKQLQNKNDQETAEGPASSDAKNTSTETVNPTKPGETVEEPEPESGHQPDAVETHLLTDAKEKSPNEDDVSFSDLEDDEDDDPSQKLSSAPRASTSDKTWVQLDESSGSQGPKQNAGHGVSKDKDSEGEDSNDWLTVDDTDFDSLGAPDLDFMVDTKVEPDFVTFYTLITGYCKKGLLDETFPLCGMLPSHKMAANTTTYTTLIHGLFNTNRYVDALTLFNEMRDKGVHPDRVTYNVILRSLVRINELIKLVAVLEDMHLREIHVDISTSSMLDRLG
ncbi:hypothetical protein SASPL_109636 [Salvia splendens]|uniref:Pentatricopeptide repeat-containing protein n=1 Tax=Salvia splendens TaxID=180675 RepID=A0A8X8YJ19_SALSN|nr:hypothetical protein SASPL_109636 [Salvia splendens]